MSSDTKPQLPRGLLSRDGSAIQPSQRLPSLRGSPLSASAAMFPKLATTTSQSTSSNSTTRGGVTKRVFKPSIPTRRTPSTPVDQNDSKSGRGRDNKRARGRGTKNSNNNNNKRRDFNQGFVQLEASVFNGIDAAPSKANGADYVRSSTSRETITRVPKSEKQVKADPGEDSKTIENLYRDDFIDDSGSDEEDTVKPKGWENVCHTSKTKDSLETPTPLNGIPIEQWLTAEDKLVLFQVPELITNRPQGHIGKLRIYKSGRVELVDAETGVSFDIVRANNNPSRISVKVKSEDNPVSNNSHNYQPNTPLQEIVSLSETSVTSLGRLENDDILITMPRLEND